MRRAQLLPVFLGLVMGMGGCTATDSDVPHEQSTSDAQPASGTVAEPADSDEDFVRTSTNE